MSHSLERYTVGSSHLVWCANPEVLGSIHWGAFDDAGVGHVEDMLRLVESARLAPSCSVIVDCRDVDSVDVGSLAGLLGASSARAGAAQTGRHALVVPPGPRGILIAGALLQRHGRWRVFHDPEDALASLDRTDAHAAHAEAARTAASVRRLSPLVAQLRRDLTDHLADAHLGGCARRLATSVRTLQRELHRHGTSFSTELRRARVETALDLLRHTDSKIDAIAAQLGLGSSSRLSLLLRTAVGLTPSAVRARARALAKT